MKYGSTVSARVPYEMREMLSSRGQLSEFLRLAIHEALARYGLPQKKRRKPRKAAGTKTAVAKQPGPAASRRRRAKEAVAVTETVSE